MAVDLTLLMKKSSFPIESLSDIKFSSLPVCEVILILSNMPIILYLRHHEALLSPSLPFPAFQRCLSTRGKTGFRNSVFSSCGKNLIDRRDMGLILAHKRSRNVQTKSMYYLGIFSVAILILLFRPRPHSFRTAKSQSAELPGFSTDPMSSCDWLVQVH